MSVEAIPDAIHEYMYEKLNDSPEIEEENKNLTCSKEKTKNTITNNQTGTRKPEEWTATDAEQPIGSNSVIAQQEERNTYAKHGKKCGILEHYAKCCRSTRKINHIAEEEAYSADDDDWTPDRQH